MTGNANYHALQISLDRRFHNGLGFGVAYTFSRTIDDLSDPWDAYNTSLVRALSDQDRPHVLSTNFIYELPFFRSQRGAGRVLGGWQLSGVGFLRSGSPMSVLDPTDTAGVGPGSGSQPWNVTGSTAATGSTGIGLPWFSTAAFSRPTAGAFGNAGLNLLRGPWFQNWDLALFKTFRFTERLASQLRFEAFNFANHPVLSNPVVDPRSGSFGLVTQKTNERNLQLGFKLMF
jgi:hypothetical protein